MRIVAHFRDDAIKGLCRVKGPRRSVAFTISNASFPLRFRPGWVLAFVGGIFLSGCVRLPVFRGGQALLPVVVAPDAAPEERAAAAELGRVLGQMSGITWPVRAGIRSGERGFYISHPVTGAAAPHALIPAQKLFASGGGEIGPDGFRIFSHDGSVFIEGATPEASGFAVAWLLQHEAGVRWYVPGASGEKIPRRTEWSLPQLDEVHEPAYLSRELTGLNSPEEKTWAQRNGLRARLEFSHALGQVFSAESLADHPGWAPLLDGQHYHPFSTADQNWQPNLALPEVAEHAAQTAATAFESDAARRSFSLGINDTVRFDQSVATRSLVEPLRYFRGMPDYSPLVFTFMNRAATSFSRVHPDLALGCLAYFWCENPPPFPVHRSVFPFVTTDRSQYYDREYRAGDLALMSRWGGSGVQAFGLYEYAYGRGFLVPRVPLAALAEAVREGWHRGARGYFAEVEPQWGFDAFKVWMLAQLLWTPDRPVADLADDFFPGYYAAAAGPMRRFFACCETQWMTQRGAAHWLKLYQQEDQALLFPAETCRELRGLLDLGARAAGTDAIVAARVARTSRAFAVTESYVRFDEIRRSLAGIIPEFTREKETELGATISDLIQAESDFLEKFKAAGAGDLPAMTGTDLAAFLRDDPVPRLLWLSGQRDAAAPRRILAAAGPRAVERLSWRIFSDAAAVGQLQRAPNLIANGLFAEPAERAIEPRFLYPRYGLIPARWDLRAMPTEIGKVVLVEGGSGEKPRVVRMEGAWDTQLYQWIPVEPDCVYVATARLRGEVSAGSDTGLFLAFRDAAGKAVGTVHLQSMPKGQTSDWRSLALADQAPAEAAWVGIGIGAAQQSAGDWLEIAAVGLHGIIPNSKP